MNRLEEGEDMEFKELRAFLAAAELSSVSRAAEKLFMSQPALSRQLQSLENELGVPLFVRGRKQLQLTHAGEVLLARAKAILQDAEQTRVLMRQVAKGDAGSLRIVATPMVMRNSVAPAVAIFRDSSPDVDIVLFESDVNNWTSLIEEGTAHLGLGPSTPIGRSVSSMALYTPKMCAVLRSDHPLAGKEKLDADDLRHETGLILRNDRFGRQKGEITMSTSFLHFASSFESLHAETLLTLAASGLGVAILSEFVAENANLDDSRMRVIPIVHDGRQAQATIVLAWHRRLASSAAAQRFMDILRAEVIQRTTTGSRARRREVPFDSTSLLSAEIIAEVTD
jgi:DNA-binding transcriptional LysR family regulator